MDMIFPALLQQGLDILIPTLLKIFPASLACGYIPKSWTKVKVVYIPKVGKKDSSHPKSQRPICLSSFMLKTMEKVVNEYIINNALKDKPLHPNQHAYQKGKSTETALAKVVDLVETCLDKKLIVVGVFIDIEGAFDNTSVETIINSAAGKGLNPTIIRWIKDMLSNRII